MGSPAPSHGLWTREGKMMMIREVGSKRSVRTLPLGDDRTGSWGSRARQGKGNGNKPRSGRGSSKEH